MDDRRRRAARRGRAIGVWLHRATKGRTDRLFGQDTFLLTSPGRHSGEPRSTMVSYVVDGGDYVVWGTGNGSPTDPDWFRNLRASDESTVEIGTTQHRVRVRELHGEERDRVWHDVVLAREPRVEKHARKAGRVIPVARLTPLTDD